MKRSALLGFGMAAYAAATIPQIAGANVAINSGTVTAYLASIRDRDGEPALGAAIARDGKILYAGGTGTANLETGVVEDADTAFLIASISKTMSAVAVMQLVEKGAVRLDDPIRTYAPWYPQKSITVRHLMTHTSGIHHYKADWNPDSGEWASALRHYATFEESTRFWRDDPLLFAPGTAWLYTTFGVALLEAVVETASGLAFEDYLKRNIWTTAGLTSTELDVAGRVLPHIDQGYLGKPNAYRPAPDEDDSYKYAAGGIVSTDRDLCLYASALNAGTLLGTAATRELFRLQLRADLPAFEANDSRPGLHQALIWQMYRDDRGVPYFAHGGSGKGTISLLVTYPKDDVAVSVHRNCRDGRNLRDVALHLARLAL